MAAEKEKQLKKKQDEVIHAKLAKKTNKQGETVSPRSGPNTARKNNDDVISISSS